MEELKFCRDCKHVSKEGCYTTGTWRCVRITPAETKYVCLVSGETKVYRSGAFCSIEREKPISGVLDKCGPEARYFEAK
jgi:hypothetical protein